MSSARNESSNLIILLLFVLSGATGLIYEVVWVRQLSFMLGVSLYAVSAVLVAFMGGLGIGSAFFGRLVDRGYPPLRLYALMEFSIGVYLFMFTPLFGALQSVYIPLHAAVAGSPAGITVLRFVMAVSIMLIPTILMGGTLPALIGYFSRTDGCAGRISGRLYGLNTLGAVVGCLLAGFYLIEAYGLTTSLRIGAVINIISAIIAWLLSAGEAQEPHKGEIKKPLRAGKSKDDRHNSNTLVFIIFALSGFCALALEVLWTRLLILALNNTTYAFTLILAIFLAGIAAGSLVVSVWLRKGRGNGAHLLGFFMAGVAVFGIFSIYGFGAYKDVMENFGTSLGAADGVNPFSPLFLYAAIIIIPATFLMGGSFPVAVSALGTQHGKIAGAVGRLYACNTIGSVAGSIAAGYFLIPVMGVEWALIFICWICFAGGAYLLLARRGSLWVVAFAGICLVVPTVAVSLFDTHLAEQLSSWKLDRGSDVIFFEQGPSATVLVSRTPYDLSIDRRPVDRLWINGDPIAGGVRETLMLERLLAHVPLLLHPNPKNGLVICFGTGSTAGAALTHGLDSLTAVDISPEVFSAAPNFAFGNQNVMENPKLHKVVEDGRNYLLTSTEKFDFISAEPPPPSNAGVVSLYTTEFYRLAKSRLAKAGIFSQWIPLHHLSTGDFKSLVASFAEVFPKGELWYTKWDAILVGAQKAIKIDPARIEAGMKNKEVAQSLAGIGIKTGEQLLSHYFFGPEGLARYVKGSEPVHDDLPKVEFSAPRILAQGVTIKGANLKSLLPYRSMPNLRYATKKEQAAAKDRFLAEGHYLEGKLHENNNKMGLAAGEYKKALKLFPGASSARYAYLQLNLRTLYGVMGQGRTNLAQVLLADTIMLDADHLFTGQFYFLKGMLAAEGGEYLTAEKELLKAVELDDKWLVATLNLAGIYSTILERPDQARYYYQKALKLPVTDEEREAIESALSKLKAASDAK